MSIAPEGLGRGGRRSLSPELNLVPYIDLLTCMTVFLLMTAVWTQLAQLDVAQRAPGTVDPRDTPAAAPLRIAVGSEGFVVVGTATAPERRLDKRDGRYDFAMLRAVLVEIRRQLPDLHDVQVACDDAVAYEDVVRTADVARGARFPAVTVTDLAGAHL
jgi:biopolymer transport protein ExbD